MDLAHVVHNHVVGNVMASPTLKRLVLEEPTADAIVMRHPSGRPVEIKVVAGARAGSSLVSRWSAGCIFDEWARMSGGDDAVINFDDARAAVIARMLPGAQLVAISSPWAPFGPAYRAYTEHFGKPSRKVVFVKAPGWDMNPVFWTPERCADLRANDPDVYETDCAANFALPEEALFVGIDAATRSTPFELPPEAGHDYTAAIDPATRGNAWTLVIATREGLRKRIVLARSWVGSRTAPLSPKATLADVAAVCRQYGITVVESDQWSGDALRDLARDAGLTLVVTTLTERQKTDKYLSLRTRIAEGEVELAPEPELRADMMRVKKRTTQSGVAIVLPRTSDGRHCDYAPAVLLALSRWLDDVVVEKKPDPAADLAREMAEIKERAIKRYGSNRKGWMR